MFAATQMGKCVRRGGLTMLVLYAGLLSLAAQVGVSATVSAREVEVGERIKLTITVTGGRATSLTPPVFDGLRLVGGPSRSSQITILNGTTSSTEEYRYELKVMRAGELRIGPAAVAVAGTSVRTAPITLLATPRGAAAARVEISPERPVLMYLETAADTLYEGDVVGVDLVADILDPTFRYGLLEALGADGLRLEQLERFRRNERTRDIEGATVNTRTVAHYMATPRGPGTYVLGPVDVRFQVTDKSPRRGFFSYRPTRSYVAPTNADTLVVLPLPSGAPADFGGLVGRWRLQGRFGDTENLTTAEALTFKLFVQGRGDINRLQAPDFNWGDGLRAYPPETTLDEAVESDTGLVYTRVFEYTVAPTRGGTFTLAPSLSYFNTATRTYSTWQAPPRRITVEQVGEPLAAALADDTAMRLQPYGGRPHVVGPISWSARLWWGIVLAGPLLVLLAWGARSVVEARAGRPVQQADPRAEGRRRLAAARAKLGDPVGFYTEVRVALERYAEERLGLPPSEQSETQLRAAFEGAGRGPEAAQFLEARGLADRGLYGGGTDEAGRRAALEELERLLG